MSDAAARADLRTVTLIAYGLFLLALVNGITAVAGVILVYIKRDEAHGTLWEGHFRNLIRVFWTCIAVAAIACALVLPAVSGLIYTMVVTNGNPPAAFIGALAAAAPLFMLAGLALAVWYLYRTVRGFSRALDGVAY